MAVTISKGSCLQSSDHPSTEDKTSYCTTDDVARQDNDNPEHPYEMILRTLTARKRRAVPR